VSYNEGHGALALLRAKVIHPEDLWITGMVGAGRRYYIFIPILLHRQKRGTLIGATRYRRTRSKGHHDLTRSRWWNWRARA